MTKCINCKYLMIPKKGTIQADKIVCTNPSILKGLVKITHGCKYGSKRRGREE